MKSLNLTKKQSENLIILCNYLYPEYSKNLFIDDCGFVLCGHRHHNCISLFARIFGFPYSEAIQKLYNTEIQGFLTSKNRFVDRKDAAKIAIASGQIDELNYTEDSLFSEDLY